MNLEESIREILLSEATDNSFSIPLSSIYSPRWKVEEAKAEVDKGALSYNSGKPIVVSKFGPKKWFIIDGNHRVIEAIMAGKHDIQAVLDPNIPDMNKTGTSYQSMKEDAVKVVDHIR